MSLRITASEPLRAVFGAPLDRHLWVITDPGFPALNVCAEKLLADTIDRRAAPAALAACLGRRSSLANRAVLIPSTSPALIASCAALGFARIAVWLEDQAPKATGSWLRSALSLADLVVGPPGSERFAVLAGADPLRLAAASEDFMLRLWTEPPRSRRRYGFIEAAVSLTLDGAQKTGLLSVLERATPFSGVNVVNYHRVLPTSELRVYGRPQMAIAAPTFDAQMELLGSRFGFAPIDQVRLPESRGLVAITFDDGYEDNYRVALPIMEHFRVPACIFLVTGLVGRDEALWWDRLGFALYAFWRAGAQQAMPAGLPECAARLRSASSLEDARAVISSVLSELNHKTEAEKQAATSAAFQLIGADDPSVELRRTMLSWTEVEFMRRRGIVFGAHTKTHTSLGDLPRAEALAELVDSGQEIANRRLGPESGALSLALPRGTLGELDLETLEHLGFASMMTMWPGVNRPTDPSLFINRRDGNLLTLRGRHHQAKLRLELTGLLDPIRKLKNRGIPL